MKGGIGNLMKQAQKMQADMQKAQEEMANIEVTGQAGGGLVSVTMTCRHDVRHGPARRVQTAVLIPCRRRLSVN